MKRIPILIALAAFIAGCASQVPLATNHPLSSQRKVKAVHHWDILAEDVTTQTTAALKRQKIPEGTPIYVSERNSTPFGKAFRNFLITRMVNRGLPVTSEKAGAVEIDYETQLVRHESSRYAHTPGSFTVLTGGIWVLRDMIASGASALPGAVGLAALADYGMGHYAGGPTPTELIITSTIARDKQYLMRKSDIYYLEDADVGLFLQGGREDDQPRGTKKLEVTNR